jgi:hypothetical protein
VDGVQGLVQVWLSQSGGAKGDALIRVIPTSEVDASLLTPVISCESDIDVLLPDAVDWLKDINTEPRPSQKQFIDEAAVKLGHANADVLADADWDEWIRLAEIYGDTYGDDVVVCFQITGFAEGRVYCTTTIDQKKAVAKLEKLQQKLMEKTSADDAAISVLLGEVCSAHQAWLDCCGDDEYPCLFGTFHQIQYAADERNLPLICWQCPSFLQQGTGVQLRLELHLSHRRKTEMLEEKTDFFFYFDN